MWLCGFNSTSTAEEGKTDVRQHIEKWSSTCVIVIFRAEIPIQPTEHVCAFTRERGVAQEDFTVCGGYILVLALPSAIIIKADN